jgi:hypothetical protein
MNESNMNESNMNNPDMDEIKINQAKIAYMLSICNKFSTKFFTKIIKQYEKSKTVAMKYYYELWFNLDIPQTITENNEEIISKSPYFELKSIHNKFLNSDDLCYDTLELLNTLTEDDKHKIKKNYMTLLDNNLHSVISENHCRKHLFSPINLINIYSKAGYKYLFISLILDYNQDVGLVHQCGLIINLQKNQGEFLFYEPYGTYIKYEKEYSKPIQDFFQIYYDYLPAEIFHNPSGKIRFNTFHKKYGNENYNKGQENEGIQNIILKKNNKGNFDNEFLSALNELNKKFADLREQIEYTINNDNNPVNKIDKSVSILDTLSDFNNYDNYYKDDSWDNEKIKDFQNIWNKMIMLYYKYNSKTCVSITAVEMNNFFNSVLNNKNLEESFINYIKKYKEAELPNVILMNDLYDLINKVYCNKFLDKVNKTNNTSNICDNI